MLPERPQSWIDQAPRKENAKRREEAAKAGAKYITCRPVSAPHIAESPSIRQNRVMHGMFIKGFAIDQSKVYSPTRQGEAMGGI